MKLIVRQYLQSLKERGELDVLLPQILSEIGYEVIHRPRRGTRQAGVDVAAVGPDPDADEERTLHLFLIKRGDLGRSDWDGTPQAVRPSLNEIRDDYIPNRVPDQFSELPISICVCIGGEVKESIRSLWRGFADNNKTKKIRYREWNGDRLANFILSGLLNKELLNVNNRVAFQKAVAMVSEPETSYHHFKNLAFRLTDKVEDDRRGTTRLRQLLICHWVLVSNGMETENLEAPYRTCELALLYTWDTLNRSSTTKETERNERLEIFRYLLKLYLSIGHKLIIDKIGAHSQQKFALSFAVRSKSALDVNLALFETMGRASLLGLWHHFIGNMPTEDNRDAHLTKRDKFQNISISLINNNCTLANPIRDDHHVEIGLLMLLSQVCGNIPNVQEFLREITSRLVYRYQMRNLWPTHFCDYRELARHPIDRSDEYFKKSTKGSVLVPFIRVALERIEADEDLKAFESTIVDKLAEMTQQVWVPHDKTDKFIWRQGTSEGIAIPVGNMESEKPKPTSLHSHVDDIVQQFSSFNEMSGTISGLLVPMFLMACRHHRLPLPPHLWFRVHEVEE